MGRGERTLRAWRYQSARAIREFGVNMASPTDSGTGYSPDLSAELVLHGQRFKVAALASDTVVVHQPRAVDQPPPSARAPAHVCHASGTYSTGCMVVCIPTGSGRILHHVQMTCPWFAKS